MSWSLPDLVDSHRSAGGFAACSWWIRTVLLADSLIREVPSSNNQTLMVVSGIAEVQLKSSADGATPARVTADPRAAIMAPLSVQ